MSETTAKLLEAILALPEEERITIRDVVQESLGDDHDPELDVELERRWQGYMSGERPSIPGEEVFRVLRSEAGKPSEG